MAERHVHWREAEGRRCGTPVDAEGHAVYVSEKGEMGWLRAGADSRALPEQTERGYTHLNVYSSLHLSRQELSDAWRIATQGTCAPGASFWCATTSGGTPCSSSTRAMGPCAAACASTAPPGPRKDSGPRHTKNIKKERCAAPRESRGVVTCHKGAAR
jgi:hypothetical protein